MSDLVSRRTFAVRSLAGISAGLASQCAVGQEITDLNDADLIRQIEAELPQAAIIARSTSDTCWQVEPLNADMLKESVDFAQQIGGGDSSADSADPLTPQQNFLLGGITSGSAPQSPLSAQMGQSPASSTASSLRPEGIAARRKKWDNRSRVTFGFLRNDDRVSRCREAFAEWRALTGLDLVEASSSFQADIRVDFLPRRGHYSLVGTDSRLARLNPSWARAAGLAGRESMNIDPADQIDVGVIRHEIGHAIGLAHEHFHHDRIRWNPSRVYAYFQQKYGWNRQKTFDNVLQKLSSTDFVFSERRDTQSIMHYWFPQYVHNNPVGTVPTRAISELSKDDKTFIRQFYNNPINGSGNGGGGKDGDTDGATTDTVRVKLGQRGVRGELKSTGEVQKYEFRVKRKGRYTIETYEKNPSTPVLVKLFGEDGTSKPALAENSYGGDGTLNARIRKKLGRGTYHVTVQHVSSTSGSSGKYRLRAFEGG